MWWLCSINDGKAEITSMPGTSLSPTPHKKCNDDTMTLDKYIEYFCAISALPEFHSAMKRCIISPTIYNKMVKTLTQNIELFWRTPQSAPLTPTTTKDGLFLVSYRQLKHWHNIA